MKITWVLVLSLCNLLWCPYAVSTEAVDPSATKTCPDDFLQQQHEAMNQIDVAMKEEQEHLLALKRQLQLSSMKEEVPPSQDELLTFTKQVLDGADNQVEGSLEEINAILKMTETIRRTEAVGAALSHWQTLDQLAHILDKFILKKNETRRSSILLNYTGFASKEDVANMFLNKCQPEFKNQLLSTILTNTTEKNFFITFLENELLPKISKEQIAFQQKECSVKSVNETIFGIFLDAVIEDSYSAIYSQMPYMYNPRKLLQRLLLKDEPKTVNLLAPITGYAFYLPEESSSSFPIYPSSPSAKHTNLFQMFDSPFFDKVLSQMDSIVESISGYNQIVDNIIDTISSYSSNPNEEEGSIKGAVSRLLANINPTNIEKGVESTKSLISSIVSSSSILQQASSILKNRLSSPPDAVDILVKKGQALANQGKIHFSSSYPNNNIVIVGRGSNGVSMPLCWKQNKNELFKLSFRISKPAILVGVLLVGVIEDSNQNKPATIQIQTWQQDQNHTEPLSFNFEVEARDYDDGFVYFPIPENSTRFVNKVTFLFGGREENRGLVCIGGLALLGNLVL